MAARFLLVPTISPDPASKANDTSLSFSHENNGLTPLLILVEVVKLVMEISAI